MIHFFNKFKKTKPPTDVQLYEYKRGLVELAAEYYQQLPDEEKIKLAMIFMHASKRMVNGTTIGEAIEPLGFDELKMVQQLIEQDYKYVKH